MDWGEQSESRVRLPPMERRVEIEWRANCGLYYSRVKNGNSVTTLRLTCFDDRFHFLGSFIENLAPRSLPKVPAFFAMVRNLKLLLAQPKIGVCCIQ